MRRFTALAIVGGAVIGCAPVRPPSANTVLSENQIIDLMKHPRKWDGRTVRMTIWPYDNGFRTSYVVCFEQCDAAYAERSSWLIYTKTDRFKGMKGNQSVVVNARYDSGAVYKKEESIRCIHFRCGFFTEIE